MEQLHFDICCLHQRLDSLLQLRKLECESVCQHRLVPGDCQSYKIRQRLYLRSDPRRIHPVSLPTSAAKRRHVNDDKSRFYNDHTEHHIVDPDNHNIDNHFDFCRSATTDKSEGGYSVTLSQNCARSNPTSVCEQTLKHRQRAAWSARTIENPELIRIFSKPVPHFNSEQ